MKVKLSVPERSTLGAPTWITLLLELSGSVTTSILKNTSMLCSACSCRMTASGFHRWRSNDKASASKPPENSPDHRTTVRQERESSSAVRRQREPSLAVRRQREPRLAVRRHVSRVRQSEDNVNRVRQSGDNVSRVRQSEDNVSRVQAPGDNIIKSCEM